MKKLLSCDTPQVGVKHPDHAARGHAPTGGRGEPTTAQECVVR
jgi:hypothetical protein